MTPAEGQLRYRPTVAVLMVWAGLLLLFTSSTADGRPTNGRPYAELELGSSYSRFTTFGAVRLSYDDFLLIVKKADTVLNSVNAGQRTKPYYEKEEEMVASSGQKRLMASRPFTQDDVKKAPPVAYEVRYVYKNRHAPITIVAIDLQGPARLLLVAGTSSDHVDALFSMLHNNISEHGTWFGGDHLGLLLGLLISIPLSILIVALANRTLDHVRHEQSLHISLVATLTVGVPILTTVLLWNLSLRYEWFPMVSVYRGEASLIVRRAPEIQIFGILVTIGLSLLGLYYTRSVSRRKASPREPKHPSDE